ncbi:hypothetical protein AB6A40_009905 [Gnathostoma spinigerum]|uniref:Uncharacterized protein n=1 Tax=Gnathostoma spinigerum TaxID=75299 RepID=A0ABD6ETM0_9BILA
MTVLEESNDIHSSSPTNPDNSASTSEDPDDENETRSTTNDFEEEALIKPVIIDNPLIDLIISNLMNATAKEDVAAKSNTTM